jgi:hypothetical protein
VEARQEDRQQSRGGGTPIRYGARSLTSTSTPAATAKHSNC